MPHDAVHPRPQGPPTHHGRAGFSLAELVCVMLLASILAGVAVAALNPTVDARRAMAARQVLRDLSFARERAVATGSTSWVVFDAAADSYSILAESAATPGRANAALLTDPATGLAFTQRFNLGEFTGAAIESAAFGSGAEIGFDWLGRPFTADGIALTAQGVVTLTGGHTITVEAGSGFARHNP